MVFGFKELEKAEESIESSEQANNSMRFAGTQTGVSQDPTSNLAFINALTNAGGEMPDRPEDGSANDDGTTAIPATTDNTVAHRTQQTNAVDPGMGGHEGEEGTWVIDFDLDGNEIGGHWVAASSMSMSGGSESTSSTSESYSEEVMS